MATAIQDLQTQVVAEKAKTLRSINIIEAFVSLAGVLRSANTVLVDQNSQKDSAIASLQADYDALFAARAQGDAADSATIAALEASVATKRTEIDTLTGNVNTLTSSLTTCQSDLAAANTANDNFVAQLATIETALRSVITDLQSDDAATDAAADAGDVALGE